MNLYQKIAKLRYETSIAKIKKSGHNKFADYKYYELDDFLPLITKLEFELNLLSKFSLKDRLGILEVINSEKPEEREIFTFDSAEANMKGMLEIQKVGAEKTYAKRYAYMDYANLTEGDAVDNQNVDPETPKKITPKKATKKGEEKVEEAPTVDRKTLEEQFMFLANEEQLEKTKQQFGDDVPGAIPLNVLERMVEKLQK